MYTGSLIVTLPLYLPAFGILSSLILCILCLFEGYWAAVTDHCYVILCGTFFSLRWQSIFKS